MVGASTRVGCRPVVAGLKSDPGLKVCLARDPGRSVEGFAVAALLELLAAFSPGGFFGPL
jgi:hypothetical protein